MGLDLAPVLEAVVAWSHKWIPLPDGAQPDTHART
jgi:DNA-binding HxlR family transcriptional regulator